MIRRTSRTKEDILLDMSFIAFSAPFQTYLKILFSRSAGRKYENSIRNVREVPPFPPFTHPRLQQRETIASENERARCRWRGERESTFNSPQESPFPFQASLRSSLLATLFQLTVARVSFKSLTREEYKGAARRNGKLNPMRRTERWVGWKMLFFRKGSIFSGETLLHDLLLSSQLRFVLAIASVRQSFVFLWKKTGAQFSFGR